MRYFYSYKLPFTKNSKFVYWQTEDSDQALGLAFTLYKTTNFHLEETTRQMYCQAMDIPMGVPEHKMTFELRAGNGGFILRIKDRNQRFIEMDIDTKRLDKAEAVAKQIVKVIEATTTESFKEV